MVLTLTKLESQGRGSSKGKIQYHKPVRKGLLMVYLPGVLDMLGAKAGIFLWAMKNKRQTVWK